MLDIMYDVPSRTGIKEVVINEDVITKGERAAHRLPRRKPSSPKCAPGPHAATDAPPASPPWGCAFSGSVR